MVSGSFLLFTPRCLHQPPTVNVGLRQTPGNVTDAEADYAPDRARRHCRQAIVGLLRYRTTRLVLRLSRDDVRRAAVTD